MLGAEKYNQKELIRDPFLTNEELNNKHMSPQEVASAPETHKVQSALLLSNNNIYFFSSKPNEDFLHYILEDYCREKKYPKLCKILL